MQKTGIPATQNLLIDYEVAGLGERIGAFLLDLLLQLTYLIILGYINIEIKTFPLWMNGALMLPVFLYQLLCEVFFGGQSLGKRQFKIKVVRLDGTTPKLKDFILRWLLRPLDIWLVSGSVAVLSILLSVRGQRLGDMAGGTTIVKYRSQVFTREAADDATGFQEDYILTFPEVRRLNEKDIALIQETLQTYRRTANPQPVQSMTVKMKKKTGVDVEMPPLEFLNVVVKDYTFLKRGGEVK